MDKFLIRKSQATDAPVAKNPKLRKYDKSYLQFGFTVTGPTEQRPQCVLCAEVLANDSMKPCKLKRHLDTKHPDLKEKPVDFFKRKRDVLQQQQYNKNVFLIFSSYFRCIRITDYLFLFNFISLYIFIYYLSGMLGLWVEWIR